MLMKLPEFARYMGVSPQTARNWYHNGTIPYPVERLGPRTIMVDVPASLGKTVESSLDDSQGKTVAYCRVSTQKQKDGLAHQKLSAYEYANAHHITIDKCVEEIGSGYNGNRKKLQSILGDPKITTIIVEHRDRLVRTNFHLLEKSLEASGRKILTINDVEEIDDLATEITEFMSSACGRIYGNSGAQRVRKVMEEQSSLSGDKR